MDLKELIVLVIVKSDYLKVNLKKKTGLHLTLGLLCNSSSEVKANPIKQSIAFK